MKTAYVDCLSMAVPTESVKVQNITCSAPSTAARLQELQTVESKWDLVVELSLVDYPMVSNAAALHDRIAQDVLLTVASGAFTQDLRTRAAQSNSSTLATVAVSDASSVVLAIVAPPTPVPTEVPSVASTAVPTNPPTTVAESSSAESGLSVIIIIAIVCSIVGVILAVICGGVVVVCSRKKEKEATEPSDYPDSELASADNAGMNRMELAKTDSYDSVDDQVRVVIQ